LPYEPPQSTLSMDIVRSRRMDGSSRLKYPSEMQRKHNTHFAHQDIDRTAYYTPCDRIGRFYTPSAAGLTMKRATKIAKALALAPSQNLVNILDYSLAATAPDAFEASAIIQHRVTQMADLKASGHGANSKLNPIKKSKDLPIHTSKTALRDAHRLQRSQPMYTILPPSPKRRQGAAATVGCVATSSSLLSRILLKILAFSLRCF
jgi:hypothetical protein